MSISTRTGRRRWRTTTALLALSLVATVPVAVVAEAAATVGAVCDTDVQQTFSLTAGAGYVSTPDGNSIYMWSYANSKRGFQLPGPTLCVTSGSPVTVILHNTLPEATSILFPGQKNVKADGNPAQPQFDSTGSLTSLVQSADAGDGSVTYTFTPGAPGRTCTRVAPTSTSRFRWGCTVPSSCGRTVTRTGSTIEPIPRSPVGRTTCSC